MDGRGRRPPRLGLEIIKVVACARTIHDVPLHRVECACLQMLHTVPSPGLLLQLGLRAHWLRLAYNSKRKEMLPIYKCHSNITTVFNGTGMEWTSMVGS